MSAQSTRKDGTAHTLVQIAVAVQRTWLADAAIAANGHFVEHHIMEIATVSCLKNDNKNVRGQD